MNLNSIRLAMEYHKEALYELRSKREFLLNEVYLKIHSALLMYRDVENLTIIILLRPDVYDALEESSKDQFTTSIPFNNSTLFGHKAKKANIDSKFLVSLELNEVIE